MLLIGVRVGDGEDEHAGRDRGLVIRRAGAPARRADLDPGRLIAHDAGYEQQRRPVLGPESSCTWRARP